MSGHPRGNRGGRRGNNRRDLSGRGRPGVADQGNGLNNGSGPNSGPYTSYPQAQHYQNSSDGLLGSAPRSQRYEAATGFQYFQGPPQGQYGPYGYQGPYGPQGYQEPYGPQGNQVPYGPQGNQGPYGPQGNQGSYGPQGNQGPYGGRGRRGGRHDSQSSINDKRSEFGSQTSLTSEGGRSRGGRGRRGGRHDSQSSINDRRSEFGSQESLTSEGGRSRGGRGRRGGRHDSQSSINDKRSEFGSQTSLTSEGGYSRGGRGRQGGRQESESKDYNDTRSQFGSQESLTSARGGWRGRRGRGQVPRGRGNGRRGRGQMHNNESNKQGHDSTEHDERPFRSRGRGRSSRGRYQFGRRSSRSGRGRRGRGGLGRPLENPDSEEKRQSTENLSKSSDLIDWEDKHNIQDYSINKFVDSILSMQQPRSQSTENRNQHVIKIDEDGNILTKETDRRTRSRKRNRTRQGVRSQNEIILIQGEESESEEVKDDEEEEVMSLSEASDSDESGKSVHKGQKSASPMHKGFSSKKKHVPGGKLQSKVRKGKATRVSQSKIGSIINQVARDTRANTKRGDTGVSSKLESDSGIDDLLAMLGNVATKYNSDSQEVLIDLDITRFENIEKEAKPEASSASEQGKTSRDSNSEVRPSDQSADPAAKNVPEEETSDVQRSFKTLLSIFGGRATMYELLQQEALFPTSFFDPNWLKSHKSKFIVFEKDKSIETVSVYIPKARLCVYFNGPKGCTNEQCDYFHVCDGFVTETCKPHVSKCPKTHNFLEGKNSHLIVKLGLAGFKNKEIAKIIRRSVPEVCKAYNEGISHDDDTCPDLHVCNRIISCKDRSCQLQHGCQSTEHNRWVLRCFGISHFKPHLLVKMVIGQKKQNQDSAKESARLTDAEDVTSQAAKDASSKPSSSSSSGRTSSCSSDLDALGIPSHKSRITRKADGISDSVNSTEASSVDPQDHPRNTPYSSLTESLNTKVVGVLDTSSCRPKVPRKPVAFSDGPNTTALSVDKHDHQKATSPYFITSTPGELNIKEAAAASDVSVCGSGGTRKAESIYDGLITTKASSVNQLKSRPSVTESLNTKVAGVLDTSSCRPKVPRKPIAFSDGLSTTKASSVNRLKSRPVSLTGDVNTRVDITSDISAGRSLVTKKADSISDGPKTTALSVDKHDHQKATSPYFTPGELNIKEAAASDMSGGTRKAESVSDVLITTKTLSVDRQDHPKTSTHLSMTSPEGLNPYNGSKVTRKGFFHAEILDKTVSQAVSSHSSRFDKQPSRLESTRAIGENSTSPLEARDIVYTRIKSSDLQTKPSSFQQKDISTGLRCAPSEPKPKPIKKSGPSPGQFLCEKHIWNTCLDQTSCPQYHGYKRVPYQWQIQHLPATWQDFPEHTNDMIERRFCELGSTVDVTIPGTSSTASINFDTMSADIIYKRFPVRRLSSKSYCEGSDNVANLTLWCWYFLDIKHNWTPYEPDKTQYILEKKYLSGQKNYLFERPEFHYKLSFTDMQQKNLKTGKIRKVLRRPMFVSEQDISEGRILWPPFLLQEVPKKNLDLPEDWTPLDIVHPFELVTLDPQSRRYREVDVQFYSTLRRASYNITSIYQVQNSSMWMKHCSQRRSMEEGAEREGKRAAVKEKRLFHGTDSEDVVRGICVNGFDHRVCGKNGTVYGKGAYFALESKYSNNYTGQSRKKYMFLAKVLVGQYTVGKSEFTRPPNRQGHILYDSCVNDINTPTIFVLFDQNQAYPEFLIEYEDLRPQIPSTSPSRSRYSTASATTASGYTAPTSPTNPYAATPVNAQTAASASTGGGAPPSRTQPGNDSKCVVM